MKKSIIFLVALFVLSGCASKEYNEQVQSIFEYETNPDLNRFGKEHMKCFICETGGYSTAITQLMRHKATAASSQPLFSERPIDYFYPGMSDYLITNTDLGDRIVFAFCKDGVTFEQLASIKDQYTMSMPIWHKELNCAHKN